MNYHPMLIHPLLLIFCLALPGAGLAQESAAGQLSPPVTVEQAAAELLTLHQAIRIALEKNPGLQQS
ncbi:MAG: hypothetical protein ACYC9I_04010, partial [Desulfuromonadales bacterium]